jgi:hypothetical protein
VGPLVFCMLNPSTADASEDDPTIRRGVDFANRFGYGRLVVVNLFALCATDPRQLNMIRDPVGPDNDATILRLCEGRTVVCEWGATIVTQKTSRLRFRATIDVPKLLSREGAKVPSAMRFLSVREPLTLIGQTPGKPGSVLIRDARGVAYPRPVGFLAQPQGVA